MAADCDDERFILVRSKAAERGCGKCSGKVRSTGAGELFKSGPYRGRYWCHDCWTLYWSEHPEDLADVETRQYVAEEAKQILLKRRHAKRGEVIYKEGQNAVYLTDRGTLLIEIPTILELQPNEFDPERLEALIQAIQGVKGKVPGYERIQV